MKESGLNYYYGQLGLNTGSLAVLYAFEQSAGANVPSISGGQTGYSGTLSSVGAFWSSPGSGFFTGQTLSINNASGLDSTAWTKVFAYEKINLDPCVLFDSMVGASGYRIGITSANKPYLESFNQEPIVAASLNNYSSKNLISFTYMPNYLTIGLYNWNAQIVESESFSYPFEIQRSDRQVLGGSFTGYMDTYIHLTQPMAPDVQGQWFSGFYACPTGTGYLVTSICTTGITGYQSVFVGTTGVTGYLTTPGGDFGQGYYTGAFPSTHTQSVLTGYLSSGLYLSGITGVACVPQTGGAIILLQYLTGYAASYGMEKVQMFSHVSSGQVSKVGASYVPFDYIYNKLALRQYSGYLVNTAYDTGIFDLYLNGVALANQGWTLSGGYVTVSGAGDNDTLTFDLKTGAKREIVITGAPTTVALVAYGQELYLNGVNLISGADYTAAGATVTLTSSSSGISGYLSEYPIVLSPQITGRFTLMTGARFWRDTSNVYLNGVRQQEDTLYVEGAIWDRLSGNFFDPNICVQLYNNNDLYWE